MFPFNAITFGRSLSRFSDALSRFPYQSIPVSGNIYDSRGLRQSAESRFAVRSCVPLARSCRRVNKQNCMRTAYVGAARTRIPRVCRLTEHRIRKLSLSFTLRPRQILFAADNFFFATLSVFFSCLILLLRSASLSSASYCLSVPVPFSLSTTQGFLRQVLCTYIKSLLPLPCVSSPFVSRK